MIPWKTLLGQLESISAPGDSGQLLVTDLIVVGQIRRGQYPQAEFDRIRQTLPLAAVVVVYGPWCEGETRSGRPLQGVTRIPVHARGRRHFASSVNNSVPAVPVIGTSLPV